MAAGKRGGKDRGRSGKTVALIGAAALVGAAVVTGIFSLVKQEAPTTSITTAHRGDGPTIVSSDVQNVNIQYVLTESPTSEAVAAMESRLQETGREIALQRSDIQLLAEALKDLDERTSGIEKLPDGRTRLGGVVTGVPTVVLEAHAVALALYEQGKYEEALQQSRTAIAALEASEVQAAVMSSGSLSAEDRAKVYRVAGLSAQRLGLAEEAFAWAQKAVALSRSPETLSLLVAALANAGRRGEALTTLTEALQAFPDAPALLYVQRQLVPVP